MSHRFGGHPEALVNSVWDLFAKKSPLLGLWVAVQDEAIVGHLLADIRQWNGETVAWITQVEADVPTSRPLRDLVLQILEDWVEQFNLAFQGQGVKIERMVMETPRTAAVWARHAGFEPYRTIMHRHLGKKS